MYKNVATWFLLRITKVCKFLDPINWNKYSVAIPNVSVYFIYTGFLNSSSRDCWNKSVTSAMENFRFLIF